MGWLFDTSDDYEYEWREVSKTRTLKVPKIQVHFTSGRRKTVVAPFRKNGDEYVIHDIEPYAEASQWSKRYEMKTSVCGDETEYWPKANVEDFDIVEDDARVFEATLTAEKKYKVFDDGRNWSEGKYRNQEATIEEVTE